MARGASLNGGVRSKLSAKAGAGCALLIGLFLSLAARGVWGQDPTIDERTYFGIGRALVSSFDWDTTVLVHPPLSFLVNSLPLLVCDLTTPEPALFACRMASLVLFGVPLLLAIFLWARDLFGDRAGFLALTLATFSPNLIAHAALITADVPLTSTGFIGLWLLWRAGDRSDFGAIAPWGLALGLALASKANAWIFVGTAVLLYSLSGPLSRFATRARSLALGLALSWFVLCLSYGFRGLFEWRSKVEVLHWLPAGGLARAVGSVALPFFPAPYLATVFFQWSTAQAGWPIVLFGEFSRTGFWYYYLVAFALKATLPFLILLGAAILVSPWVRAGRSGESWLLVPPLILFAFMSLTGSLQIGVRYVLPAFPFLFVFASKVAKPSSRATRAWSVAVGVLLFWHACEGWRTAAQPISYFNQLVGERIHGYRYLADSNVDWGQNSTLAEAYARDHGMPINPSPLPDGGRVLVSVNALQGILADRAVYRALRERYDPVDHVGYNWLVFDLDRPSYAADEIVPVISGPGWVTRTGDETAGWVSAVPLDRAASTFDPVLVYPGTAATSMRCASPSHHCVYRTDFVLDRRAAGAVLHLAAAGGVEVRLDGRRVFARTGCDPELSREERDLGRFLAAGEHRIEIELEACGPPTLHELFVELLVEEARPSPG